MVIQLLIILNCALVLIPLILLVPGLLPNVAADVALEMPENRNVWTGYNTKNFSFIGGFKVAGACVYLHASELAVGGSVWGAAKEYGDARLEGCRAFRPVPSVMQTV